MSRPKKSKHFLEQKEALKLAASITEVQEDKALSKAEKHHQAQRGHPQPIAKLSVSKSKIKETKALIATQRARCKKAKAKSRRNITTQKPSIPEQERKLEPTDTRQKRVSFA